MKSLIKEAKLSIPKNVLDRAHRIGPIYTERVIPKKGKSITTFHHRTLFYRARKNLKNAKAKLNLTKSRFDLLERANNHVNEILTINFGYADVNCRLWVKFYHV